MTDISPVKKPLCTEAECRKHLARGEPVIVYVKEGAFNEHDFIYQNLRFYEILPLHRLPRM